MTVTFIDVPGPLSNTYEPIDFTTTTNVTSISVEFNAGTGTGARETVFDGTDDNNVNGDFSFMYGNSSRTGSGPITWTIKRRYRWPAGPMRIRVKEAVGGGAITPTAALQPTLYSPVAQYALQGAPNTARLWLDRSPNGYNLETGNGAATADLISGQTAVLPNNATRLRRTTYTSALQITQDLTVTLRVKRNTGGAGALVIMSGIFGAGNQKNTLYSLGMTGTGALEMFWEKTAGVSESFFSANNVPNGIWTFISLRRTASGTLTWGVNELYNSITGRTNPLLGSGTEAFLNIGNTDEAPNLNFDGAIADVCIWNTALTDDQVGVLYRAAMGL